MREYEKLMEKIHILEYHQKLLLKLVENPKLPFYKLIIEKGLTEADVESFFRLCGDLCEELGKQKAEGFVYFHPLFNKLSAFLPANINMKETVEACLGQKLYEPLFKEFEKYI
ncbi:DUF1878 family protein [Bacillus sp. BRMEA1]|uniref:DUF1878 family protein n=1 Tax=Neobacillus endophyticus TaxID=2738405 RepID=UPI0015652316|nr:DUF1878 family protein [Neobacillus endophyticus]NRD78360.1 DUF1878 family protein [Neobacillus endophyticus]